MKIVIINPPDQYKCIENPDDKGRGFLESDDFGAFPPLGALYVLSYLEAHSTGHQLHFIDCVGEKMSHQRLRARLGEIRPDLVGITSFTISLLDVRLAARAVREIVPGAHICLGGHHPIAYPLEAAGLAEFDSVVVGEGEYAFSELVKALDAGADFTRIQGVYTGQSVGKHIGAGGTDRRFLARVAVPPAYVDDLDAIPMVNRNYIRHIKYHNILGVSGDLATVLSSRGCPYLCTFCDVPYKAYRQRSAELVLDEIQACMDMGYGEFRFYDDLFNITPGKVIEFCQAIEDRGMKFPWDFRGRANTVSRESLLKAKQSGLRMIAFGVETGTDEGLKLLKKGAKTDKFKEVFAWCRELGILTVADYLIGLPFEKTPAEVRKSIDFLIELDPDFAQISILKLYPNTALHDQALDQGIVRPGRWQAFSAAPEKDFLVDHWNEHLDLASLIRLQKSAYRRFYFRPRYILRSALGTRSLYELSSKIHGALKLLRSNQRSA